MSCGHVGKLLHVTERKGESGTCPQGFKPSTTGSSEIVSQSVRQTSSACWKNDVREAFVGTQWLGAFMAPETVDDALKEIGPFGGGLSNVCCEVQ